LTTNNYPVLKKMLLIIAYSVFMAVSSGAFQACKEVDEWTKYSLTYESEAELKQVVFTTKDSFYEVNGEYLINFDNELEKRAVKEKQIERITRQMLELSFKSSSERRDFPLLNHFHSP
jgi:hypothetical protein